MRTLEEVRARYADEARQKNDMFGFSAEVLGVHLPEGWKEGHQDKAKEFPLTEEFVRADAIRYLAFAFEKALDHRGISASRSVTKMREYAWLLGLDDAMSFAENSANYTNYGVPILKHVAKALGVELPPEIERWEDGMACRPGCEEGCGQ